jgi:hypothetical protein
MVDAQVKAKAAVKTDGKTAAKVTEVAALQADIHTEDWTRLLTVLLWLKSTPYKQYVDVNVRLQHNWRRSWDQEDSGECLGAES